MVESVMEHQRQEDSSQRGNGDGDQEPAPCDSSSVRGNSLGVRGLWFVPQQSRVTFSR